MSSFLRASPHLVVSESFQVLGGAGLPSSRLSPLRSSASFQLTSNWVLCRLLVCCWFLDTKSQGRGWKSSFFTSVLYAPRPWWAPRPVGGLISGWANPLSHGCIEVLDASLHQAFHFGDVVCGVCDKLKYPGAGGQKALRRSQPDVVELPLDMYGGRK